jgi:hypothetical protein
MGSLLNLLAGAAVATAIVLAFWLLVGLVDVLHRQVRH